MATESDECQHEHVADFIVDDERLSDPTHKAYYLKCVDCGLITADPSREG